MNENTSVIKQNQLKSCLKYDIFPIPDCGELLVMSILSSCLVCRLPITHQLHTFSWLLYREDFLKLGLSENATKGEIKAAYFERAKQLHPDSYKTPNKTTENEFLELNEAYKRLMYEIKHGTDSFDETDPRNDPRNREYWDIRRRTQTEEQINVEAAFNHKNRVKEKKIIRWALLGSKYLI